MPVNAHPASQHGVNEAKLPLQLRVMRVGFRALTAVSRRAAARVAVHFFVTPRRHPVPERERRVLDRGERFTLRYKEHDVAAWAWEPAGGATHGTAILVHGWEGRGGQLAGFVDPLVGEGYRVVAFDHVGHGESGGKRCSLPTMRDTLRAVSEQIARDGEGPGPSAIVAHSMGTFATTLVLAHGWPGTRAVYVSPPADMLVYFGRYLELATGSQTLLPEVFQLLEARYQETTEDYALETLVRTVEQPLLVQHSVDDRDVPLDGARKVAERWPGAEMIETDGLGHRRILRDADVIDHARAFLSRP